MVSFNLIFLFSVCLIIFDKAESIVQSGGVDDYDFQHCVCVPYWQCKEDYSGLIDDGQNIIDVRLQPKNTCTGDFDVCCQIECGRRKNSAFEVSSSILTNRILGENNEVEFAEFPWMLGLLEDKVYTCGASLIHPQVALTAAHCVVYKTKIVVRAGEWNWIETTEPLPHQNRVAKKIIFHPLYHPASLRNDVALIILDSPFRLTENVGLACLPPKKSNLPKKNCIVTGWGKNSHRRGKYQTILRKVELSMISRERCLKSLQDALLGPYFNLHNSFICAGGEFNKDACMGDGGGPLICPVDGRPGRYEQLGIVSWGVISRTHDTPGVYVNLSIFRDWIDAMMKSLNFDTNIYKL